MAVEVDRQEIGRRSAEALEEVRKRYGGKAGSLIPSLQLIQERVGYLPREALEKLGRVIGVPEANIYGVVTFYAQFSLVPRGRHTVRVCRGTACHVRGSAEILAAVKEKLGVEEGATTADLRLTLEVVACLGTCFLAPVMMVDSEYYGSVTSEEACRILSEVE
ncbi:MAG: NADH-quinone oxidoreductase subunit NuoE [Planctomycetota bacterium]